VVGLMLLAQRVAARTALKSQVPRLLHVAALTLLVGGLVVSGWATTGTADSLSSYSNLWLVFFATVLLLRLLPLVHYNPLVGRLGRDLATAVYYVADVLLAYVLNGVRFVLSLFDILTGLQAQLLFSTAYARQVQADEQMAHTSLPALVAKALPLISAKADATRRSSKFKAL
jgi:hypothetical protein